MTAKSFEEWVHNHLENEHEPTDSHGWLRRVWNASREAHIVEVKKLQFTKAIETAASAWHDYGGDRKDKDVRRTINRLRAEMGPLLAKAQLRRLLEDCQDAICQPGSLDDQQHLELMDRINKAIDHQRPTED